MLKFCFAVISIFMMIGCTPVSTVPLAANHSKGLTNREISLVKRVPPDFGAMTAGKAMFGALGGAAMISAGNEIVKTNGIVDPSGYIARELQTAINTKYGSRAAVTVIESWQTDVSQICANNPGADLILDVRTINWMFSYFPTTWGKYRVSYSVSARLIDNRTKTVIAEGFSHLVPDETPDAPTHEELLANQAARLKAELKKAADFCISDLKARIFLPQ